ncbi:orexin receptor type 2-like [Mytilus trossulus]|uniref:orexin receptor type 2-like n=1 Tax=Mytilus trossulus TaxID=6551 RepID=UPI0030065AC2
MTVAEKIYKIWIYGDALCKLVPYLQGVAITASILTITSMSLDRCLAIRHPVRYRHIRTTKYVRIVVVVIWIISLLLAIPMLFVRSTVTTEILPGDFVTFCSENWENNLHRQIYDIILLVLIFIIPSSTLLVAYFLMGKKLWVPDRKLSAERPITRRSGQTSSERERSMRNLTLNRRRLAKLCIAIAVVFIMCWTPYFIVSTYLDFRSDVNDIDILSYTLLIGHMHCVTNPIVYCFLHKTFRHYVFRCFSGHVKKRATAGVYEAPYMTLNRGTPNNSNRKGSIKSLSSQRRASSSTSSTQGRMDEKGNQEMPETLKGKLLLRNNFTPLDIEKYNLPRKLEIPSIIKEESKAYSSQSRSRSDLF